MKELIVALVTPFVDNKIDEKGICNIISGFKDSVDGILVLGSTGESRFLSLDEKKRIVQLVRAEFNKKIIVGLDGTTIEEIISLGKELEVYDIDSFLIAPIPYVRPTQNGLIKYYMELADHLAKPIFLYQIPKRTGVSIDINTIKVLKNHPNIIGIKDAGGDEGYTIELASMAEEHKFIIYGGDDARCLTNLLYKASGLISVVGNKYAREMKEILSEFPHCDLLLKHKKMIDTMFLETSPLGIKYALGSLEAKKELGNLSRKTKDEIDYITFEYDEY